jgi:5-methylcytosine-specific restriction protein A
MVPEFLTSRGFQDVEDNTKHIGMSVSQTIHATIHDGTRLSIRVKLCWRPRESKITYSAVQLLAKIRNGDWEGDLRAFVDRARRDGVTHFLFAQREDAQITEAALVPAQELIRIWCAQRDKSEQLIREGRFGKRKKNHAMNGSSPTLWLRDETAPAVTEALWKDPHVQNLVNFQDDASEIPSDTCDDLDGIDVSLLGSDGAGRLVGQRSFVKRSPRVRTAVLARAKGKCERCQTSRAFISFLDVHHILGAEKSDRVWNCVAICPNCHREAHFAPDCDQINSSLLDWAMQFRLVPTHDAS